MTQESRSWAYTQRKSEFKTAHGAQYQKNKQLNKEMGRRPKQTFLQKRHTDGQ